MNDIPTTRNQVEAWLRANQSRLGVLVKFERYETPSQTLVTWHETPEHLTEICAWDHACCLDIEAFNIASGQADFEAHSQVLVADPNFKAVITVPAWRSKPSWMLVAGSDRTINPDLERWYAVRANSHKVEVTGASHSVYVSHPKEVAALIEQAAQNSRN